MPELSRPEWLLRLAGVAPFAPLVLATVLTVLGPDGSARAGAPTIALATVAAGWLSLLLMHRRWAYRAGYRLGYFGGLLALMTALTAWSPWYALVAGVAGPQALVLFTSSRGALAGLVAACVLPSAVQASMSSSGLPEPSYPLLLSLVLPLLAAGWVAGRENDHRRALLRELSQTQQELVDQAHRAGIAVERSRITGELHDTLTQTLTATVARLEAAQHLQDEEERQRQLVHATALARNGLAESRRTLRALGAKALEGRTLSDALWGLEARLDDTYGPGGSDRSEEAEGSDGRRPSFRVEIAGTAGPVPSEIEHALYRVATEAVTNAARHAQANSVHVSLSWLDDLVLLDVTDDGVGFHQEALPVGQQNAGDDGHRLGLATMRQRVRHVGGELIIESRPGEGTAISASIPLTLDARQRGS